MPSGRLKYLGFTGYFCKDYDEGDARLLDSRHLARDIGGGDQLSIGQVRSHAISDATPGAAQGIRTRDGAGAVGAGWIAGVPDDSG